MEEDNIEKLTKRVNVWGLRILVSLRHMFVCAAFMSILISIKGLIPSIYLGQIVTVAGTCTGVYAVGFVAAAIIQFKYKEKLDNAKKEAQLQIETESDLEREIKDNNRQIDKENYENYESLVVNGSPPIAINPSQLGDYSNVRVLRPRRKTDTTHTQQ